MGITLTRKSLQLDKNNPCKRNWSIEVSAVSTLPGLDARVFVYHAASDNDPVQGDLFSNVASLQDMNTIPPNKPTGTPGTGAENYIPFYRVNKVTFDCYTASEVERIWRIVQFDVKHLVYEHKSARKLTEQEVVTYE